MNIHLSVILVLTMIISGNNLQEQQNQSRIKGRVKLAMAQMLVEGGNREANLARAEQRIATAANQGADIILLPEISDLGWTHSSAKSKAEPIPGGSTFQRLARAAKENNIYVCAGITERDGSKTYNSAVFISSGGELLLKHRKINELDIAHHLYAQGHGINACETEFGTIGVLICADATAKDYMLTRSMGYLGADLILLPSSWAVPPDHDNQKDPYGALWKNAFSPVCKEFDLNIAAVSNVGTLNDGPWKEWLCIGNSMFFSNQAEKQVILPYGAYADTIFYQDVVMHERPARGTSWSGYWSSGRKQTD